MKAFIIALQFLTRFNLSSRFEVFPEDLGRSVRHFPVVGAVIGLILLGFAKAASGYIPDRILAVLVILLEMAVTGGLHCDGLMDTMDGIFSGRSREKMLEIMKDSRVGAYGVMGFGMLLLLKWTLVCEMFVAGGLVVLFIMPVLGRFGIVIAITAFPYARAEGLGKAFAQFAGQSALGIAIVWTLLFTIPLGMTITGCFAGAVGFAVLISRYVCKRLGGLTGDVYGAITEMTEVVVLLVFVLVR
ncbi:MAG: Cobalamin synthase [Firmicutes bacterium]|nr:Cobalamin synthase [Bacillota bacterium]